MKVETFDARILSGCTKFSHALQRTTGLTCYFIAKIGVFAVGCACLVAIANYFLHFLEIDTPLWIVIVFSLLFLVMVSRSIMLTHAEENLDDVKPRFLMRDANEHPGMRLLWFVASLFQTLIFIGMCIEGKAHFLMLEFIALVWYPAGMAIFFYFVAVDPLPPGKSRVREWFSKLSVKLIPVRE